MSERATPPATPRLAPQVRIVILNYNGAPYVERSVAAALATDWPPDRLEVVVIDNASTDGSAEALAARFPALELRRRSVNGGFVANNDAFADLDGVDYVALVNNDAFVEPGWLAPLVDAAEADDSLGAVSAKILFDSRFVEVAACVGTGLALRSIVVDGLDVTARCQLIEGFAEAHPADGAVRLTDGAPLRLFVPVTGRDPWLIDLVGLDIRHRATGPSFDVVNNAGNALTDAFYGVDRGYREPDGPAWNEAVDIFAFCGNGVLFRADFIRDVGGFDERYFAYYEDIDLAWRGRERGWRYRYVPTAVVRHLHASTAGAHSALFMELNERNRLLTLAKHASTRTVGAALARFVLVTASYARRDLPRRRPEIVKRRLRAFGGFLRLAPAITWARARQR